LLLAISQSVRLRLSDDWANFTFWVGIDPTGGANPFADTVIWGQGAHIYNAYAQVPPVEVTAQSDTVTVFLRSQTQWAFKHNDAYWDSVSLEIVEGDEEPEPGDGATKLGAHVLRVAAGLSEYIAAKPAVVKFAGEWGSAANVPDGVLAIGRKHQGASGRRL
jgi:hypothetical protein